MKYWIGPSGTHGGDPLPEDREATPLESAQYRLDRLSRSLLNRIDDAAESARLRHITAGAGQQMEYIYSARQAMEFLAPGFSGAVPVFVQAEATSRGITPQEAAQAILDQEAAWLSIGATIKQKRRTGKLAVAAKLVAAQDAIAVMVDAAIANTRMDEAEAVAASAEGELAAL